MSLLRRAEAFMRAKAVSRLPADAIADLATQYEERMAMVLEGGDASEAEAHGIATAECGASIGDLRDRVARINEGGAA